MRRKRQIGELLDLQTEALGCRLQEIAVARRALRVELEILHAAILENDQLDILTAHVDDHVRIFVELDRRFGMGHCFDEPDISVQNILEHVFGVARRSYAKHFELRALVLDLFADGFKLFDGVLDRIAAR